MLEQKVYLTTSSAIYPNLYILLTGDPGTGKTRTIRVAQAFLSEIQDFHLAPNSFTFASLVDCLAKAKRMLVRLPEPPLEYNTLMILADEIGTFLHKYEREMSDGLSAFYDPMPYGHERRGQEIRIKIASPQLNILCGLTPSTMLDVIPESAWGQGLMSRMIMIFADERIVGDDFAQVTEGLPSEMVSDLQSINTLVGEFKVTEEYQRLVLTWKQAGESIEGAPIPSHPKLLHYNSRRRVNLYKLSMIASIDRSDVLVLDREAFNTAMSWLADAEAVMPDIFKAGAGADSKVIDDILYFVSTADKGKGVSEHFIRKIAHKHLPVHSAARIIEILENSGQIVPIFVEKKSGVRYFKIAQGEKA